MQNLQQGRGNNRSLSDITIIKILSHLRYKWTEMLTTCGMCRRLVVVAWWQNTGSSSQGVWVWFLVSINILFLCFRFKTSTFEFFQQQAGSSKHLYLFTDVHPNFRCLYVARWKLVPLQQATRNPLCEQSTNYIFLTGLYAQRWYIFWHKTSNIRSFTDEVRCSKQCHIRQVSTMYNKRVLIFLISQ